MRAIVGSGAGRLPVGDPRRYRTALVALVLADAAYAFQQTAVIPVLPTIGAALDAPPTWTAWLLSGYLVVAGVATPILGKLADRHGKRRVLVGTLAVFFAGSVGAALAPDVWTLIGFRALQGAAGAVFPISFSITRDEFPEGRITLGIGILTGAFGAGAVLGYGLSGALAELVSWRLVFGAGAAVVLVAALVIRRLVPASPVRSEGALDLPGGLLLGGGLVAGLVALTESAHAGWASPLVVGGFAGAAVLLGAWVWRELATAQPLLALDVLRSRPILATNAASFLAGFVAFAGLFLVPHLVEAGPVRTSLYLVPSGVGLLLAGPLAGVVGRRAGGKWPFAAGLALAAVAAAWLALLDGGGGLLVVGTFLLGSGGGLSIGAAGALVAQAVSETETAVATSLNSVVRLVGGGVGSQLAAALLVAVGTGPAFTVAAGAGAAGALIALLVPRRG